jgi:hypothetical protein
MAMVIHCILAIGSVLRIIGQKLMLTLRRPARVLDCQQIMAPLHFLQEHNISTDTGQCLLDTVYAWASPQGTYAFMDIPSRYAKLHESETIL